MEEKKTVIIGNADLITMGSNNRHIEDGGIYAEDGIIKKIDSTRKLQEEYPDVEFIDMEGMLTLPGNIISHTHLYSTFARGMALGTEAPSNFVEILQKLWWKLDKSLNKADNYFSALYYLVQCIKSGTTTIIDHHASPSIIDGVLDVLAQAVFESGIRASLCYEVTDRNGKEEAEAGIRENSRFLEKCRDYPTSFVKGAFGIHASFTVSDETMLKCIETAGQFNAVLHLHVEEDMADRRDSEEKYGVPVMGRLEKLGATELPILAIHCVHLADSEFEIISNNNVKVVHNPSSNMNNGVGVAPVPRMLREGITVGLGTDGMSADAFDEMKILPLLQKVSKKDPRALPFDKIYQVVFENNTRIANLFWKKAKLGAIEEGYYADVIGLKYNSPTPIKASNILGHLLYGINSCMVDTTIVNGQLLMKNRKLLHLDEKQISLQCQKLASNLWERI